jgi:hypothetical protein
VKTITCFDECLHYVNRLGVVKVNRRMPGWIPEWQRRACWVCDRLNMLSRQHTWYHKTFKPFDVHFQRSTGRFLVWAPWPADQERPVVWDYKDKDWERRATNTPTEGKF